RLAPVVGEPVAIGEPRIAGELAGIAHARDRARILVAAREAAATVLERSRRRLAAIVADAVAVGESRIAIVDADEVLAACGRRVDRRAGVAAALAVVAVVRDVALAAIADVAVAIGKLEVAL